MSCKCTLAQRTVGDGCEICNPAKALDYAKETIDDLQARVAELEAVLSQYADKNNWGYYDDSGCDKGHGQYTDACFIGPELARATLEGKG